MPAGPDEPVGSVAEEAAKLVATLGEWVRVRAAEVADDLEACPAAQELRSTMTAFCQSVRDLIDGDDADGRARSSSGFQTIDLDDPEGT